MVQVQEDVVIISGDVFFLLSLLYAGGIWIWILTSSGVFRDVPNVFILQRGLNEVKGAIVDLRVSQVQMMRRQERRTPQRYKTDLVKFDRR